MGLVRYDKKMNKFVVIILFALFIACLFFMAGQFGTLDSVFSWFN